MLKPCWYLSLVLWHSPDNMIMENVQDINQENVSEFTQLKLQWLFPRDNESMNELSVSDLGSHGSAKKD